MNLEEYFKRIGFTGSSHKPDVETLKLIHKQHVMTVPFENLSMHCGERIVMDLEMIFNKIVRCNRGGWCLENNYLFGWVLREIGYDCTTLNSKVFIASANEYSPLESHLIHKVVIDGKAYIADVSYGMSTQVWEPLELISGKDQHQGPGVFRLINQGDSWVLEKTSRKPKILNPDFAKSSLINRSDTYPIHRFTLEHHEPDSFLYINDYLQTDPASLFINKSICCLQTPTGFRSLIGWTYSEVTFKPEEGVDYYDMRNIKEEEVDQVLREKFNIHLQRKLTSVANKSWFKM
ncbi:arylamine N-acetyltransferase, pineal gland isozyme NAT-10-like [Halichoeres trimaculatus]|uniref:arylamine N-acetyltransferase, pineal gland isozyme NAT-10-like n=1 Tax=Halichoeres trimaculatus TaxID=147232 RepID=UPI003D9DF853